MAAAMSKARYMSTSVRGGQPRYVRDAIVQSIRRGEIAAGDILSIAVLATQLRVSATPVREALNQLLGSGLVSEDSRGGFSVRRLDARELAAFLGVRCQLLLSAVRVLPDARTLDNGAGTSSPLELVMAQAGSATHRECWDRLALILSPYQQEEKGLVAPPPPEDPLHSNGFRLWIRSYHRLCQQKAPLWITG